MKMQIGRIFYAITLVLILASCTAAHAPVVTPQVQATIDLGPINTAAVQTYVVESTRKANLIPTATEVILPTNTPEPPTATPTTQAINTTPIVVPTLWIPASGSSYPTITASLNTNCRSGPDKAFEVVGALNVGSTSEVYGKLRGGGWWYIKNVSNEEPKFCWVWAETTVVTGDTDSVPYIQAPVAHPPKVTVGISVVPDTSVICPTTFVFTGTVTSDRATNLLYEFVYKNGNVMKAGEISFPDDGTQTVTFSKSYDEDVIGTMQLKITYPVTAHSAAVSYTLTCP